MTETALPLSLGGVAPGPDFTKMPLGKRADGLTDGFHTGGVWLDPDGQEVWKPLDGRPYVNATERYPTNEDVCLEAMADKPGFPVNWRVEESNGRRWLVRPLCWLWPQDRDVLMRPKIDVFLMAEEAIRQMNEAGWEYNDAPQLAYDPTIHEWFVLDCSSAYKPETWSRGQVGDWHRIPRWFEQMGLEHIKRLRERGYHVYHAVQLPEFNDPQMEPYNVLNAFYPIEEPERRQYVYVYASCNRPMSYLWARMDGVRYLDADTSKSGHVHTWVVADHLLDQDVLDSYELTFAYRPWP